MKRLLLFLLLPLTLCAHEWDNVVFNTENDPSPCFPFTVSGSYFDVKKTHFRTPGFTDKDLKYRQWEAAYAYTHPITPCSGLIFGAGWIGTEVAMEDNPSFDQTIFNYVNLSLAGYTKAFPDWIWTLSFATYLDTEVFSLIDYTLYQGVLWGKYDLCKWLELDFGVIVEVGLKRDKVWPIVGFIYLPSDNWKISTVYPINISVEYAVNPCLTAGVEIRFFRNRHRVKQTEPLSQAIFEYRTAGAEFDLTYSPIKDFFVTGFAGSTFNGNLKIGNRNDHHATHFKFNGSFYGGVSALYSF